MSQLSYCAHCTAALLLLVPTPCALTLVSTLVLSTGSLMIVSMFLPIAGLLGGKIGKDSIHYSPHCQDILLGGCPSLSLHLELLIS